MEEKDGKLFRVQLTDRFDTAGISLLAGSATIEEIDARFCKQLRDADLTSFSELTNLKKLYLPSCVGDQGVQQPRSHKHYRRRDSTLTQTEQLTWLDVPNLRYLQLQETRVSRTGWRQIRAALPGCEMIPPRHDAG
ncbi:MAG: hypothetical protein ACYTG0_18200 [Planctomycetota bacterium]